MKTSNSQTNYRHGFTLIEIMIVVIILGILGALALFPLANAAAGARDSTLRESVNQLRTQLSAYMLQHRDNPPAATDNASFRNLVLNYTDENGNVGTGAAYKYGPYMTEVPANAINGKNSVMVLAPGQTPTVDNSTGWIYQIQPAGNFILQANNTGQDSTGIAYKNY